MRSRSFARLAPPVVVALLALVPALLYAYIGTNGRLLWDDYCRVLRSREFGVWGYTQFILNEWSGSYSQAFLGGLLAPLDTLAPRIASAVIIAIWLAGAYWLMRQGLDILRVQRSRRTMALVLAALLVAASIHALDFGNSMLWLISSTRHTLPIALLTGCLALTLHTARHYRRDRASALRAAAVGLCFFVCGGLAETFVVFQLGVLSLCLLSAAVLLRGPARWTAWIVLGAAWLASLASLGFQYFAPGTANRNAVLLTSGHAVRSLQPLALETLRGIFDFMARPELPISMILLMALGALAASYASRLHRNESAQSRPAASFNLRAGYLWCLLALQLAWLPILWAHTSDDAQVFARFSFRYMTVILLNIGGLLVLCAAIWRLQPLQEWLRRRSPGAVQLQGLCLACALFVMLIAIPPLPIDRLAAAYLFTSVGGLLLCIMGLSADAGGGHPALRLSWLALAVWVGAWLCAGLIIALSIYAFGGTMLRSTGAGFAFVAASGLVWGAAIGCCLQSCAATAGDAWHSRARAITLAVLLLVSGVILTRQGALLGNYRIFAAGWDANHSRILALSAAGEEHIEIDPVPHAPRKPLDTCTADYYDVTSIAIK